MRCIAPGCTAVSRARTRHRYCAKHIRPVRQYGHPNMRALRVKEIRAFEARIRASLRLLSPSLRSKIETNAARVVALLLEYVDTVMGKEVAHKGAAISKLPATHV